MIFEQLKISIRSLVVLSILTGFIYPLAVTGFAHLLFPQQAQGSLIFREGIIVGSRLIGQPFDDPRYFWGRISATTPVPFNGAASSGSNLGPRNPALLKAVDDRVEALKKYDPSNEQKIPVDLVSSSASGLDPHISPASAFYQLKRVAQFRGFPVSRIETLIQQNTEGRFLGILGEPRVNVLGLNLALDEISYGSKT